LSPLFLQAYAQCPSKGRAVLLTYSLKRQMRLVFLAQQGLQERQQPNGSTACISMSTIMSWSEAKMQQLHPQYNAWYSKHAAAAVEAEQAARAAAVEGNRGHVHVHAHGAGVVGDASAAAQAPGPAAAAAVADRDVGLVPW
jgi:hypothetical protein